MNTIRTALVSTSSKVDFARATRIAAALQKQLTNDFFPIWNVHATINAFPRLDEVPLDHWPVVIKDVIGVEGDGIHWPGEHKAEVSADQPLEKIPVTCSHELLEMLADPSGKKLSELTVPPPDPDLPDPLQANSPVKFLIEICDPCQTFAQGYFIDGVRVCNFCTPQYYHADKKNKRRFFRGGSGFAREVLGGGYVSFQTTDNRWWRTDFFVNFISTTEQIAIPAPAEIARDEVGFATGRTFGNMADSGLLSTDKRPLAGARDTRPAAESRKPFQSI